MIQMRRVSQKKCLHGEWFFVSNNIFIENFHDVKFLTFCNFIYLIFLIWYWIFYLCWQWRWIEKNLWYKCGECHERSVFMVSDSFHQITFLIQNLHLMRFLSFLILFYLILCIQFFIFYFLWQWRWIKENKWYKCRECHERSFFMVSDCSKNIFESNLFILLIFLLIISLDS